MDRLLFSFVFEFADQLDSIDQQQPDVKNNDGIGPHQRGIDGTDDRAGHVENAQLGERCHHHGEKNQTRAQISEQFKIDIHNSICSFGKNRKEKRLSTAVNHLVDNHYWWLVETLARIASIYLSVLFWMVSIA
jgi:hypothetical protein